MTIGRVKTLVSTNWLREKLIKTTKSGLNGLRVLDTSWSNDPSIDSYKKYYQYAHIPEAVHFDLNRCVNSTKEIPRNLPDTNCFTDYVHSLGIGRNTHIIAYDSVNRLPSFRTWWLFRLYGHKKISILDGGFMKWVEDGFQTSVEEHDLERADDFEVKIDKDLLFDFEMMKKNLEKKSHQMVDARGATSFIGEEDIEEDIKHGHIPGARNIPFSDLFYEDGTFKSEHALKELFDAANIDLGQPVVASCLTGMTACGLAAAMHVLGKEKVPVYNEIDANCILAGSTWPTTFSLPYSCAHSKNPRSQSHSRVIKDGEPKTLCFALENIDDVGDATANNIKAALDKLFQIKVDLSDKWLNSLVSITADGASVNTGAYNGLMTQLSVDREWLIQTHCVSHRLELALKTSLLNEQQFVDVRELLISLYYYCKKSGKFVRHISESAAILGVSFVKIPKVHGTRFLSHQLNGIDALVHNWVILLQGIENSLESSKQKNQKLIGYLNKLKSVQILHTTLLFRELLSIVSPLSMHFQKNDLQVFEIMFKVQEVLANLDDVEDDVLDNLLSKNNFVIEDEHTVSQTLLKSGHSRRLLQNQEQVTLTYQGMTAGGDLAAVQRKTKILLQKTVPKVKECLQNRFASFENEDVLKNCKWLDPANWDETNTEDLKSMNVLASHFEVPLNSQQFEVKNLKREWKGLKLVVKNFYSKHSVKDMWRNICKYRHTSYPNVCLLVNLVQCLGMSTATVESGFSHLTTLLSDRRLSMSHSTMEALLVLKVNYLQMSQTETDAILESALDSYLSKRRLTQMSSSLSNASATCSSDPQSDPVSISESATESESDSDTDVSSYESECE